jgi:hypothetical protein
MGLIKLPEINNDWSKNEVFGNDLIADIMTKSFREIHNNMSFDID